MSWSYARSALVAGAISVLVFTFVHHLMISDIWFSVPLMLVAGALSGLALAWNYRLFAPSPTLRTWAAFNGLYVLLLLGLGALSLLVFEPITTMAAVVNGGGAPDELFGEAMPLTAAYTLFSAVLVTTIWGRDRRAFPSTLLTSVVLILLFGLNISTIGLVDIPGDSAYVAGEFCGLVVLLDLVFAGALAVLEQRSFSGETEPGG